MDSCSGGGSLSGLLWDHCGLHRDRDSLSCNLAAVRRFFCSFGSSCPNLSEISGSDAYVDSRIMVTLCASGGLVVLTVLILIFGRIPAAAEPDLDYVIVLGASVKPEGVSRTLKLRLDKAAEYAKQNPSTMLILSGGQGADEPCTEASAMRQYLAEKGVSPERMILEEQSQSTTENIAYSRLLLKEKAENGKQEVGILTSNFHLLRARLIAAKQGMKNIRGIAAESDKILFAHFCFRDSLAILKDRLMGNL